MATALAHRQPAGPRRAAVTAYGWSCTISLYRRWATHPCISGTIPVSESSYDHAATFAFSRSI